MKIAGLKSRLKACDLAQLLSRVEVFVTEQRKARIDTVLHSRLSKLRVALESPYDPHNAAAVLRSCDAFGILNVDIVAPEQLAPASTSVTAGADGWLSIGSYPTVDSFSETLHSSGFRCAGAVVDGEMTLKDIPLDAPMCILLGNENRGLSNEARELCDYHFRIPMLGMTESLNLSVCAALCVYELSARLRMQLNQPGDLSEDEKSLLKACYYLQSVNPRLAQQLIKETTLS